MDSSAIAGLSSAEGSKEKAKGLVAAVEEKAAAERSTLVDIMRKSITPKAGGNLRESRNMMILNQQSDQDS